MENKYKQTGYLSRVKAIYSESICELDKDNPYIKALPLPLTDDKERMRNYTRTIPSFDCEKLKCYSDTQKRILFNQLSEIRFYLPFETELEIEFYNALLNAYRSKTQVLDSITRTYKLVGNTCKGSNPGFSLTGLSGTGKSSSFELLLSRYPQVIQHEFENGNTVQIVYLIISCSANSNFSMLYAEIGRAIDQALDVNIYENMINKARNLGTKQQKITELFERFAVGALILDEIQLIDFNSTKENSIQSLLVLQNTSKTSLITIGNEEALDKLYSTLRVGRRIGRNIESSIYCDNREYLTYLIKLLFKYQLFNEHITPTPEIIDALITESKGIINILVLLYMAIQDSYLSAKTKPIMDKEFVSKTMEDRFGKLKKLLLLSNNEDSQKEIQKILKDAKLDYEVKVGTLKQQEEMAKIVNEADTLDLTNLIQQIYNNISTVVGAYSFKEVEDVAIKVIKNSNLNDLDISQVTKKVFEELTAKKVATKSKPSKKKTTKAEMVNYVLGD